VPGGAYRKDGEGLCTRVCSDRCPGFSQDRVNFHRTPGRGSGGRADPSWPNRAGCSMPWAITLGSGGGERGGGSSRLARERTAAVRESGSLGCAVCVVFSPHLYRCCSCSLCLLFCYTARTPTRQFLPLSFRSSLHPGGGRGGRVALVLRAQPNQNNRTRGTALN